MSDAKAGILYGPFGVPSEPLSTKPRRPHLQWNRDNRSAYSQRFNEFVAKQFHVNETIALTTRPLKLSAYIVAVDSGFSPNPYGRLCTLACCKPTIRRMAEPGDIVVGSGSARSGLGGRLIYAMRVREVLPFQDYWERYPSKRPSSRTAVSKRGDNIWHTVAGAWRGVRGALHNEAHQARDLRGENALIAEEFYYFGREAIAVPKRFAAILASTQGHKNTHEAALIARFWAWLENAAPRRGRVGQPTQYTDAGCRAQRAHEDDDDDDDDVC